MINLLYFQMYLTIGVGAGGLSFEDRSDGKKPWKKYESKSFLNFYNATNKWKATWSDLSALQVDYVKVWAL